MLFLCSQTSLGLQQSLHFPRTPSALASKSTSPGGGADKVKATRSHRQPLACTLSLKAASLSPPPRLLRSAIALVASLPILLCPIPVDAGILSGFSGLESVPGPQLPEIDFLKKWNEGNQKKYAEFDSRFKSSTVLKEFLEKSRLNKERNSKAIQDKYCLRGAEWGVGDCSTQGMTQEERDEFLAMLKKNAGAD